MSSRSAQAQVSSGPFPGWEELWPQIAAEVERKVRRKLPPGVEPADVSNEVAARLLAAANVPPPDRLRFWCLAVARCVVADLYRRRTVAERDLPILHSYDVEQTAISRLRLWSVVEAVSGLSQADRDALTRTVAPMTDAVKARRKRARKRIRERMTQSVGAGVAIRRVRWLIASGAVTAAIPVIGTFGWLAPSSVGPPPDGGTHVATPVSLERHRVDPPASLPAERVGTRVSTQPAIPPRASGERIDAPVVGVGVPGASGTAGVGTFDPGESGPAPLACARNLRVAEDVCVDHPLR